MSVQIINSTSKLLSLKITTIGGIKITDVDIPNNSSQTVEIPENSEEKSYEMKITAQYSDEESITQSFTVGGEAKSSSVGNVVASLGNLIKLGSINPTITTETIKPVTKNGFKSFSLTQDQWILLVDLFLIIGIIVEIIIIKSLRSGYK